MLKKSLYCLFFLMPLWLVLITPASSEINIIVKEVVLTEKVENREPVGTGVSFPNTIKKLYCYTRIEGIKEPTTISHVWYFNDVEMAKIQLNVKGSPWRTWSSKAIEKIWIGKWKVEVISATGDILATKAFNITASQSPKPKSASEYHSDGLKFYRDGKYRAALNAWQNEDKVKPGNTNTLNNIGMAHRMLGDLASAIKSHKRAIMIDPGFGHGHYSLGVAYADIGKDKEALMHYEKAIGLGYANGDVYAANGSTLKKLGRCEEAIKSFKKAIKLRPVYGFHLHTIGLCYMEMGENALAIESFNKDIERNPQGGSNSRQKILEIKTPRDQKNAHQLFALAISLKKIIFSEADFFKAVDAFKAVIKKDSSYPDAHMELGKLYAKSVYMDNHLQEAISEFKLELKHNRESKKAKKYLEKAEGQLKKYFYDARRTDTSIFDGINFPTKAFVAKEKARFYDGAFNSNTRVSKGFELSVIGVYRYTVPMQDGDYIKEQVFYIVQFHNSTMIGLINTKDLIFDLDRENPWYRFQQRGTALLKTPVGVLRSSTGVTINKYNLWIKTQKGEIKQLGEYQDGLICNHQLSLSLSPDGKHAFLDGANILLSTDGSFIKKFTLVDYSSPVWFDNFLFLRGLKGDGSAYKVKVDNGSMWSFAYIEEGMPLSTSRLGNCYKKVVPVQVDKGFIKLVQYRRETKDSEPNSTCYSHTVTATKEGEIIKSVKKPISCNEK